MNEQSDLSYMATLYMALADPTRLRLLRQMYAGEVCVGEFTNVLGDSQPKVSRHLAYLRNAGIVGTRRDGKWIHYSIRWPEEDGGKAMLRAALEWLAADHAEIPPKGDPESATPTGKTEAYPLDIYANADMEDDRLGSIRSAHNELEEFLL